MASDYNPKEIEAKWQKKWLEEKVFAAHDNSLKPKYYQLETFPYPSGAGLHVGHPKGYIAEDIHARYMRMKGREVLYAMGWDAFGLPTENYALKVGRSPQEVTQENTDTFRRQVRMFGLSYDWDREINTSSPDYYKWTQWLFIQLFNEGLAYRKASKVNWCPKDQTVLANEQVIGGKCERCGSEIEERDMEQWFLKITDYTERLLGDLKGLDWPAATIKRQEDWIGKSEGAEISFPLNWAPPSMDLVFATNNTGKVARMQKLFKGAGLSIALKTPRDIGITDFDVVEDGATLAENAEKKARSLAAKTSLPVFADDTGFFIDGAMIDPVTVKRNALEGVDEKTLTVEQVAIRMQKYYTDIATARGGRVDAEWRSALCFVTPEKFAILGEAIRPVILTNEAHGVIDPALPLRGFYISKVTGKYTTEETDEEEVRELQPIADVIKKIFTPMLAVFTTRPDTLFGATYLVLAPEHPFVSACIARDVLENTDEIKKYVEAASHKTERMRQEEAKEKTGAELRGVKAINPANKKEIPIWIADYVLGSYGTGAIMAVPAHDERDFEFAKKFGLESKEVIEPETGNVLPGEQFRRSIVAIVEDPESGKFLTLNWGLQAGGTLFIGGGREDGEDEIATAIREITEETGYSQLEFVSKTGTMHHHYFAYAKNIPRNIEVVGLYLRLKGREVMVPKLEEQEKFMIEWLTKEEVLGRMDDENHLLAFRELILGEIYTGKGILKESGQFSGLDSGIAQWKITEAVGGKRKTQYKLRDWSVSRQRYWGAPIPIIYCEACRANGVSGGMVPVPEKDLPVLLPALENYRPQGMPPLAGSPEFINVQCPKCGAAAKRDPETLDTFVDSSWYYLRYADPKNIAAIFDKVKAAHWMPVDLYVIGAEHTVLHLLYSRFITKFLYDEGRLGFNEPFLRLRHQGLILATDGQKMSKSKGNVVNPDEVVGEFGADAARLFWMFMGPFEDANLWNPKGILGVERFLKRFWKYVANNKAGKGDARMLLHRTIKKVGEDIELFKFNTAISSLMILLNELEVAAPLTPDDIKSLLKLLHPFAPHMAQELWSRMNSVTYLDFEPWPQYDPALIKEEKIKLVLQVNSRVKDSIEVDARITEAQAKELALANIKVKQAMAAAGAAPAGAAPGASPKKIIYVDKKLVNVVV